MKFSKQQIEDILSAPTTDVETAGALLGIAKNASYKARKSGDIPSIKVGGQYRVPTATLRAILTGSGSQQPSIAVPQLEKRRGRPPRRTATFEDTVAQAREGRNVRVQAISDATGMSVNGFYAAARRGDIKTIRVGRAVLVPGDEALRLLGEARPPSVSTIVEEAPLPNTPTLTPITLTDEQFRQFLGAVCDTVRDAMRVQLGV